MIGCTFCSIARGEAPADPVYEDDHVIGIMDIHPATLGHVLVIPRRHSTDLSDVPVDDATAVMRAAVRVARMLRDALPPDGVNLLVASGPAAWQTVFHFHLHVVPRYAGDSLVRPWSLEQPLVDLEDLEAVAVMIRRGQPRDA